MLKNKTITKKQGGFTILELIIATSVFSLVLLIVTTGLIKIGQTYYKGRIQNRTQETARSISEDISRTIQLAGGQKKDGTVSADFKQFCIGDTRYTIYQNKVVGNPANPGGGLKAETIAPDVACDGGAGTNPRELLAQNMRILRFRVDPDPVGQARTWRVNIRIAYGENDLLTHYNDDGSPVNASNVDSDADGANCKSGIPGGSFCATAQLDTLVKKRLNIQ